MSTLLDVKYDKIWYQICQDSRNMSKNMSQNMQVIWQTIFKIWQIQLILQCQTQIWQIWQNIWRICKICKSKTVYAKYALPTLLMAQPGSHEALATCRRSSCLKTWITSAGAGQGPRRAVAAVTVTAGRRSLDWLGLLAGSESDYHDCCGSLRP